MQALLRKYWTIIAVLEASGIAAWYFRTFPSLSGLFAGFGLGLAIWIGVFLKNRQLLPRATRLSFRKWLLLMCVSFLLAVATVGVLPDMVRLNMFPLSFLSMLTLIFYLSFAHWTGDMAKEQTTGKVQ